MRIELSDYTLVGLTVTPARLRLEMAVGLYASDTVTLGQGAAIADVSQSQFQRELGRRGVCIHYGVNEFEEDLETLKESDTK